MENCSLLLARAVFFSYFLSTVFVAMTFTPVLQTFSMTMSPRWIGACKSNRLISLLISNLFSFGAALSVRTDTRLITPFSILAVDVMVRLGWVTSLIPYSYPRGQKLPVTVLLSVSTTISHPLGQLMQTLFLSIYSASFLREISISFAVRKSSFLIRLDSLSEGMTLIFLNMKEVCL